MENKKCVTCENTGRVSIKLDENCAPFSFRCFCNHGKAKYPAWPEFNPENISNATGNKNKLTKEN